MSKKKVKRQKVKGGNEKMVLLLEYWENYNLKKLEKYNLTNPHFFQFPYPNKPSIFSIYQITT